MLLFGLAAPAAAQYMRITTDNPTDNTRMRPTGTTILTISIDTNHDKNGTIQTCNSHQVAAGCPGAVGTAQPLDMFGYTIALKTVGGAVQWGTFTASDANYTNSSPQIQNNTEVEVNQFRPTGTFTPPGPATIGTIPATILAGTPAITLKIGYSQPTDLNPAGFGTGFATECDGTQNFNFYIVGDPTDPCGAIPGGPANGLAGDWFDWDGVSAPAQANSPPVLDPIANMTLGGCGGSTADQAIRASDPDGDAITFTSSGPSFMTLTSNVQVGNTRTGNIHLAPQLGTTGTFAASVTASSGSPALSDTKSFVIAMSATNCPPVLSQPANMTVNPGATADQTLTATDPNGDALQFTKAAGPTFLFVTTTSPGTGTAFGNIHLAPGSIGSGTYQATVRVSDGSLTDDKSFTITVSSCRPPDLAQPANMTVNENATADQVLAGSSPDGRPLTFTKAAGPIYMTVTTTTINPPRGNVHLAPGFSDAGTVTATVNVADDICVLTTSGSFTITVNNVDRPVSLAAINNMTVAAGATADQTFTATDPDADAITFTHTGPSFMTRMDNAQSGTTRTGSIHLAPTSTTSGTFGGSVTAAANGATSTRTFTILICFGCENPPTLAQPANMTVNEGAAADQTIVATDPDGNPLAFSKASGPAFITVTTTNPGTGTATGNIHLAPGFSDQGTYGATVTASDGTLSDSKSFSITVNNVNGPPTLNPIPTVTVKAGTTADVAVTASDPDNDPLTFTTDCGTFLFFDQVTRILHIAPGLNDVGTFTCSVTVSDGQASATRSFFIIVLPGGNRCPTASPGGPYSGLASAPVNFDGTASSDPDGDPLTYAWDFDASDGITVDGIGASVSHAYVSSGAFTVTLTVTDNGNGDPAQRCSNSATTTATIQAACDATVFNGYDTIRLGSGKPFWFAYVQPVGTCYNNSDVLISSFVMKYAGRQISASGKTAIGVDKSGDGIQEIKISFAKDDLRTLFTGTGLANGHNTVTVTLESNLVGGGRLIGTTQLDVVNNGSFNVAVSPNPLNPQATLTWTTSRAGFARIEMFDIQGRLVRGLVDEPAMAAGTHEATIDGRTQRGESLPSGVYFIRGTLSEGEFKQIITILK
jgi:hypothetical protein